MNLVHGESVCIEHCFLGLYGDEEIAIPTGARVDPLLHRGFITLWDDTDIKLDQSDYQL
jgi:hypothetical protein